MLWKWINIGYKSDIRIFNLLKYSMISVTNDLKAINYYKAIFIRFTESKKWLIIDLIILLLLWRISTDERIWYFLNGFGYILQSLSQGVLLWLLIVFSLFPLVKFLIVTTYYKAKKIDYSFNQTDFIFEIKGLQKISTDISRIQKIIIHEDYVAVEVKAFLFPQYSIFFLPENNWATIYKKLKEMPYWEKVVKKPKAKKTFLIFAILLFTVLSTYWGLKTYISNQNYTIPWGWIDSWTFIINNLDTLDQYYKANIDKLWATENKYSEKNIKNRLDEDSSEYYKFSKKENIFINKIVNDVLRKIKDPKYRDLTLFTDTPPQYNESSQEGKVTFIRRLQGYIWLSPSSWEKIAINCDLYCDTIFPEDINSWNFQKIFVTKSIIDEIYLSPGFIDLKDNKYYLRDSSYDKMGNEISGSLVFPELPKEINIGNLKYTFKKVFASPYYPLRNYEESDLIDPKTIEKWILEQFKEYERVPGDLDLYTLKWYEKYNFIYVGNFNKEYKYNYSEKYNIIGDYQLIENKKYHINPTQEYQTLNNKELSNQLLKERFINNDTIIGYEWIPSSKKSITTITSEMLPVFGTYTIDNDYSLLYLIKPYTLPEDQY